MKNNPDEAYGGYRGAATAQPLEASNMVKAARGSYYRLPLIGDYAEKWSNALRD